MWGLFQYPLWRLILAKNEIHGEGLPGPVGNLRGDKQGKMALGCPGLQGGSDAVNPTHTHTPVHCLLATGGREGVGWSVLEGELSAAHIAPACPLKPAPGFVWGQEGGANPASHLPHPPCPNLLWMSKWGSKQCHLPCTEHYRVAETRLSGPAVPVAAIYHSSQSTSKRDSGLRHIPHSGRERRSHSKAAARQ